MNAGQSTPLNFLSATTLAESIEELQAQSFLIGRLKGELVGIAWFALISALTFYHTFLQASLGRIFRLNYLEVNDLYRGRRQRNYYNEAAEIGEGRSFRKSGRI